MITNHTPPLNLIVSNTQPLSRKPSKKSFWTPAQDEVVRRAFANKSKLVRSDVVPALRELGVEGTDTQIMKAAKNHWNDCLDPYLIGKKKTLEENEIEVFKDAIKANINPSSGKVYYEGVRKMLKEKLGWTFSPVQCRSRVIELQKEDPSLTGPLQPTVAPPKKFPSKAPITVSSEMEIITQAEPENFQSNEKETFPLTEEEKAWIDNRIIETPSPTLLARELIKKGHVGDEKKLTRKITYYLTSKKSPTKRKQGRSFLDFKWTPKLENILRVHCMNTPKPKWIKIAKILKKSEKVNITTACLAKAARDHWRNKLKPNLAEKEITLTDNKLESLKNIIKANTKPSGKVCYVRVREQFHKAEGVDLSDARCRHLVNKLNAPPKTKSKEIEAFDPLSFINQLPDTQFDLNSFSPTTAIDSQSLSTESTPGNYLVEEPLDSEMNVQESFETSSLLDIQYNFIF